MDGADPTLTVDEFVDYCRTQAGLLSGSVETLGEEVEDLLAEAETELAELRSRLGGRADDVEAPASARTPDSEPVDVAAVEDLEADLTEKQTLAEAKQARMQALQELAAGYADLAEELVREVDDGREAMDRVVRFEADVDAPAAFSDRQTVLEAVIESRESDGESR